MTGRPADLRFIQQQLREEQPYDIDIYHSDAAILP